MCTASGDLRNVVKSLGSLPGGYNHRACLFVNDLDFQVVARNLVITLIGLLAEEEYRAVECMLHLWYSALIRKSDLDLLRTKVLPLFEDVNCKIQTKASGVILGKTWNFGQHNCRVELTKEKWMSMLSFVREITNLSTDQAASEIRTAVTLAPGRKDYRDRMLFTHAPQHRLSIIRFHEDGILVPFGAKRDDFVVPNPFVTCSFFC
ncbi:hypothetical protein MRB53_038333 [Persea americana]|nr:hypothetical protein MRB53_038333 [Persea americana]